MSSKRQKLELEVLKGRDEKNTEKVNDALKQLSLKYGSSGKVISTSDYWNLWCSCKA